LGGKDRKPGKKYTMQWKTLYPLVSKSRCWTTRWSEEKLLVGKRPNAKGATAFLRKLKHSEGNVLFVLYRGSEKKKKKKKKTKKKKKKKGTGMFSPPRQGQTNGPRGREKKSVYG